MPINLSHREVRDLAKNLRDLTGREIKHTQILEAIARAVGRSADSMMHELKNENAVAVANPDTHKAPDADHMVLRVGFSQSPNGRRGRWTMRVLERRDPDPATLDVVIEPISDLRWLPHLDPAQPMWIVKAIHTGNAWSTDKVERIVGSVGADGLSLQNAINVAFEFVAARHHLWGNVESTGAEYELHELNPLAQRELDLRNEADEAEAREAHQAMMAALKGADPESAIGKARLLGFKPQYDERGRGVLVNDGFIVSMNGPSWHLEIDNSHPSGSNAPTSDAIWAMHIVFSDYRGQQVVPAHQVLGNVTLEDAVAKADSLHRNIAEIEEIWAIAQLTSNEKETTMTAQDSIRIAKQAGFEIWDTGGGCQAFAKLLREVKTPGDDVATMDLMITKEGGTSINAAPDERVWGAGINYTDPRGGDSPIYTREDTFTLEEAIAKALEFEQQADEIWEKSYDAEAIKEYEFRY
jgi:hypothetical protein